MQEIGSTPGMLLAGGVREHLATINATLPTPSASVTPMPYLTQTWQEKRAFCELAGTWLAEAAARTGRHEEALRLARAALAQAEVSESAWFLCAAHTTLGRLIDQLDPRDNAGAEAHLLAALHHAEAMHSRPLRTHILLALGDVLGGKRKTVHTPQSAVRSQKGNSTTNDKNRARDYLTRAADLAGTLGMHTAREQSLALLAQLDGQSLKKRKKKM